MSAAKYTEDYYAILGLTPESTLEDIAKQYNRLKNMNNPEKLKALKHVYGVLSHYRKRYEYDLKHHPEKVSGGKGVVLSDLIRYYEKTWQKQAELAQKAPKTKDICATFAIEIENSLKEIPIFNEATQEGFNKILTHLIALKNLAEKHKVTQSVIQDKTKLARDFFKQISISLTQTKENFIQTRKTAYTLREGVSFVNSLAQESLRYAKISEHKEDKQSLEAFDQFYRYATDLVSEINHKALSGEVVYQKFVNLDMVAKRQKETLKDSAESAARFDKMITAITLRINKWFPGLSPISKNRRQKDKK